jgi:acetoin:2,6-dichlorophenolindophenol oxidoreductase subunit alpha
MGQGPIYECLNMAAIWKLPMIFVCENNGYAESTSAEYALSTRDLARRAAAFEVPASVVDGQDIFDVYHHMGEAVSRARDGGGPTFLECKTYRYYGHFLGDDPLRYRTAEEEAYYHARDCIERFERAVVERQLLSQTDLAVVGSEVESILERAVEFAERSPVPDVAELTTEVYA